MGPSVCFTDSITMSALRNCIIWYHRLLSPILFILPLNNLLSLENIHRYADDGCPSERSIGKMVTICLVSFPSVLIVSLNSTLLTDYYYKTLKNIETYSSVCPVIGRRKEIMA